MEAILVAGTSHPLLAEEVANKSGCLLGQVEIREFPDGETSVEILENVRDREVFVLQSVAHRPNHFLMELCILIDALKRASAGRVTVVIPYFGYARQDRRGDVRAPITAKLVADLLQTAGADHLISIDLHTEQIQGFFDIPVDNLHASSVLLGQVSSFNLQNGVVVAPDVGSIKMAKHYAHHLKLDLAVVDKERQEKGAKAQQIIGDVKGRDVLITDDMVTTGSTLATAADRLKNGGAGKIYAAIAHGVFTKGALDKINASPIDRLFVTDTVPNIPTHKKLHCASVAPLLGEALVRMQQAESLSTLLT